MFVPRQHGYLLSQGEHSLDLSFELIYRDIVIVKERKKMSGKCPYCGKLVTSLRGNGIEATFSVNSWKAVTYSCPACNSILSCQIDPVALKTDIINGVVKKLSG